MRVLRSLSEVKAVCRGLDDLTLVPTMGALHAGHLSLVAAARDAGGPVAVSIFVNPLQFGPHEDLERYPRQEARDIELLTAEGADLVLLLDRGEMYPAGFATHVTQPALTAAYEGAQREGHFEGVLTVVAKLFLITGCRRAVFGQKDFQQTVVVRRMAADLDLPVEVRVCPIVRDPDGLALSSRNAYLDADGRRRGLSLVTALQACARLFEAGERDPATLEAVLARTLEVGLERTPDYAVVVDPETLERPPRAEAGHVALVAGRVGRTRLLDNHVLGAALGPFGPGR